MLMKSVLCVMAILLPRISVAQHLIVNDLPSKYCRYEDEEGFSETPVYRTDAGEVPKCVLEFAGSTEPFESKAFVSLNGKVIKMFRTQQNIKAGGQNKKQPSLGKRWSQVYLSKDKTTKAILTLQVVDSSCSIDSYPPDCDTDACSCVDEFRGTLRIERGGQSAVIPVVHGRNG